MQSLIQCQRVQVSGSLYPLERIILRFSLLINFSFFSAQQILLLDEASKGNFSRVFDYEANDDLNVDGDENAPRTSPFESRFPINFGITGHVAATGEVSMTVKQVIMCSRY